MEPLSLDQKLDKLEGFPAGSQDALRRYLSEGDEQALDRLLELVLIHYLPSSAPRVEPPLPPETKLQEDLGMDSLTMTEIVFLTEELFDVTIENAELIGMTTLGDLQQFVRKKLAANAKTATQA